MFSINNQSNQSNQSHKYENFNIDQLVPILTDINLAKTIIVNMVQSLNEYIESLYEILNELKESGVISDEIKAKMDKNVTAILNDLSSIINQNVSFRNLGTKKEKLFERLKRGISYKYKLANGAVTENPELLKLDVIKIDSIHRTLEVGSEIFQFSDSSDYIPLSSDMSNFLPTLSNIQITQEETIANILEKIQIEISKTLIIQAYLDIVGSCVEYILKTIITDVYHFNLFDPKVIDGLNL